MKLCDDYAPKDGIKFLYAEVIPFLVTRDIRNMIFFMDSSASEDDKKLRQFL